MKARSLTLNRVPATLAVFSISAIALLHGADGTWDADANGDWSNIANWNSGVGPIADGADFTATLADVISNNRTITNDGRTIGNITVLDTSHNYTISSGTLTLDVTSGSPTLSVPSGRTLTISSVVAGNDGFTKTGDGTATLSASNILTSDAAQMCDVVVSGGLVNWGQNGNRTFDSLSGSGDFYRTSQNGTLTILDASAFTGNLRTFNGGNSSHTIEFQSISDAVGSGNLQTAGGTGDSNQRTRFRLFGDVGPLTFDNRAIEILSRQATPRNWSGRGTRLDNDNATPANTWVINTDLINQTDRNHELELWGNNTGDNTFAGVISDSTGIGGLGAFYSTQTGALTLIKDEAGKWILTGANTYTGNTIINNGTLEIRGAGQLGGGNYAGSIISNDASPNPFTFDSSANQTISGTISGGMEFIKEGTGTLSLTGSAAHSGGTTVNNGTLSLGDGTNSSDLNDFGSLSVATGAVVDLNYTGSDNVFLLNLGGSPAAGGTWGATGSGATNIDDTYFTGTGVINNLAGDTTPLGVAFYDGGNIGATGDASSDGGAGVWDTSTANWDYGTVARAAWLNTTSATANFGGVANTVTLDADVNVGTMNIEVPSAGGNGYFIGDAAEDNTITFGGAKVFNVTAVSGNNNQLHTIRAGIAGAPTMNVQCANNNDRWIDLKPTANVTMDIGFFNLINGFSRNTDVYLGGQSSGNVIDEILWDGGNSGNQLDLRKRDVTNGGPDGSSWTINKNFDQARSIGPNNNNDANIYVEEGTLTLLGTDNKISHWIRVFDGGRIVLQGNWRIHDEDRDFQIGSGGIASPGPGIKTVTFNWNSTRSGNGLVDFQAGSTFEWEVGAANATDVIGLTEPVTNGNAELVVTSGATLKVIDAGGSPSAGDKLTVFTCESGVTYPDVPTLTANMAIDISGTSWTGTPTWGIDVDGGTGDATIYITGLSSGGAPSAYDLWVTANSVTGGTGDDDDVDDLDNLLEFGFGTDPKVSDNAVLVADGSVNGTPLAQATGGGGGVTHDLLFVRRDDHGTSGSVSYTVRFSGDLVTFYDSTVSPTFVVDSSDDPDYEIVSIPYPTLLPNGQKATFAQIVVEQVP